MVYKKVALKTDIFSLLNHPEIVIEKKLFDSY